MFKKLRNLPSYLIILLLVLTASFVGIIYFSLQIKPKISSDNKQAITLPSETASPTVNLSPSALILPSATPRNKEENRLSEKGIGFDLNVMEPKIGSISVIKFKFSNEPDTELVKLFKVSIPAGWKFTKGEMISGGAVVGKAVLNMVINDRPQTTEAPVTNDQDTQGHKAHWTIILLGLKFDVYVDEEAEGVHIIKMERGFVEGVKPPSSIEVTIFANSAPELGGLGVVIFEAPGVAGNYNFEASAQLFDQSVLQFKKNISLN